MVGPQVKRRAVHMLREERGLGITRGCGLVRISRSLYGVSCYKRTRRVTFIYLQPVMHGGFFTSGRGSPTNMHRFGTPHARD